MAEVRIVLSGCMYSGNLGSVARAMKNMELTQLHLVQCQAQASDQDAKNMAVGAKDLLSRAQLHTSLDPAVADCKIVIGTSRRIRAQARNWLSPKQMKDLIAGLPPRTKVAFVFGNEESGLSNDELDKCQYILHLPTNPEFASLNLAASVLLVAYELYQLKSHKEPQPYRAISTGKLQELLDDWQETLTQIGFFRGANPVVLMRTFKTLLQRAGINEKESNFFRGICRKIRWLNDQSKK